MAFIKHEQAWGPDGKEGPDLFAYLKGFASANGDNGRDVISTIVRGVDTLKSHQSDTAAVLDWTFRGWL